MRQYTGDEIIAQIRYGAVLQRKQYDYTVPRASYANQSNREKFNPERITLSEPPLDSYTHPNIIPTQKERHRSV